MNKFFLSIYDRLSRNRPLSIALLLVVTALCVFSALRLDYKENIADFLPTDPEKEKYTSVSLRMIPNNFGYCGIIYSEDKNDTLWMPLKRTGKRKILLC